MLVGISVAGVWSWRRTKSTPIPTATYYTRVPLSGFSETQIPLLSIHIEGQTIPVKLDLGFRGDLSLPEELISSLKHKRFLKTISMTGIRGKLYKDSLYQIPKFSIANIAFKQTTLQKESPDLFQDSILAWAEESPPKIYGRIGWELFYHTTLFLDLQNEEIILSDSFATLQQHGYFTGPCTRAPLILNRRLPEIDAETSQGPLRCLLDTGSTWNILNVPAGPSLEIPSFKIAGQECGAQTFRQIPLQFPIPIDAILGTDFFFQFAVFIDFANKQTYFAPSKKHWRS